MKRCALISSNHRSTAMKLFHNDTWQRKSLDSFCQLLLVQEPQIFPCVYAIKGCKAQEHLYCFIDSNNPSKPESVPMVANALRSYAQRSPTLGPMTSLVILMPKKQSHLSHKDYRKMYWDTLRGVSLLDDLPWPTDVPEKTDSPRWCFCFHGQKFVSLAMTPSYQLRHSRYSPDFCIVFQPLSVFRKLMPTPERANAAMEKVRGLTDTFDDVGYSPDVLAVGNGAGPMSNIFFINDTNESAGCPFATFGNEA